MKNGFQNLDTRVPWVQKDCGDRIACLVHDFRLREAASLHGRSQREQGLTLSHPLISFRGFPLAKPSWKLKVMHAQDVVYAGQVPRTK